MAKQEQAPIDTADEAVDTSTTEDITISPEETEAPKKRRLSLPRFTRLRAWMRLHPRRTRVGLAALVILLITVGAIPKTRYAVLGLFMKKDVQIYTIDSQYKNIVYNANVTIDGKQPFCGADKPPYPNCFSNLPVGEHTLVVEAGLYKKVEMKIMVGLGKAKLKNIEVPMEATGRQILVEVTDLFTGKPLGDSVIKYGDIDTKTTSEGNVGAAGIFAQASQESLEIEVSKKGYNTKKVKISVKVDPANPGNSIVESVTLTPAGRLFFLSKLSGKIDVVSTNLDGTDRKTVLAATGKEQDGQTILLASRDWKYLALKSRRDSDKAKLYLIDTTKNNELITIDEGNADFTLDGWLHDSLVYRVDRAEVAYNANDKFRLKTFNASSRKLSVIDSTKAENQSYQFYTGVTITENELLYAKNVSVNFNTNLKVGIYRVKPDGSGLTAITEYQAANSNGIYNFYTYNPEEIYWQQGNDYYEYEVGGKAEKISASDFNDGRNKYLSFLVSPGGKRTFWAESRDGKNALFTGNLALEEPEEIGRLSELNPYGWFTDDYLLLSKNGSELYIMGSKGTEPLKVTDYHKPTYNFQGYGYGYGGF